MQAKRVALAIFFVLLMATPVQAGTESRPEIRDSDTDTVLTAGTTVPHLDISKAWIQAKGEHFVWTVELAGAEELPKENVVVFHYTWRSLRLFWMANWTTDGSSLDFVGGAYQGTPSVDRFGNKQYLYLPGPDGRNVTGKFEPGAPAKITWSYRQTNFGEPEELQGLQFTGLFVSTYQREDRIITMFDFADGSDFLHIIRKPWYERLWDQFVPAPSMVLGAALIASVAFVVARRRN